jgi:acyl-CoA synthetase (AMP-forming)/AMP-acid ligase II
VSEIRAFVGQEAADLTVGRVTRHFARLEPGKRALHDGERSLTYLELDTRADALAGALAGAGVQRGEVVSAYLPNCIDYVLVVLAVARAGAVFSPINPRYKAYEVGAILRQARPRVVFTTAAQSPIVREAASGAGQSGVRVVNVDDDTLPQLLAGPASALPVVGEGDYFSLMFTSGTTGEPKGAMATHRARMLWVLNATIQYGLDERDHYLGTMPQVHSAGLTFTLMHLYAGATVRILPHFDPAEFVAIVARERVTSALTVPTMLTMIVEEIDRAPQAVALGSLKRLVTCGSPLPLATKRRVIERVSDQLYDYYGSTESNSMTVLRPADQLRKPESVGQAFRNVELMIADEAGHACPTGTVGEVWCVNPSAMSTYRDRPEDTARAFTGRWFHTGDLGYLDAEGFLHLVGRLSDVVISGGVNIYPAEIEQVLMLHPSILDAAVVGEPDAKWGQRVKAFVVVREGESLDFDAVQRHCANLLADFKKPRSVVFLASLPKNAGGKTVKSALQPPSPLGEGGVSPSPLGEGRGEGQ